MDFREAHETGSSQLWLGELSFRRDGSGKAWLSDLALRELSGDGSAGHPGERPLVPSGANLLWEADVNRPARGSYNLLDAFLLDELVAAAEQHGIYLRLCLLTRDLYMGALKDPAAPEYRQATRDATSLNKEIANRFDFKGSDARIE